MKLITDEVMTQILNHYSDNQKEIVKKQILKVEEIIIENKENYINDVGFQKASDIFLKKVIEGNFL
ncbi:hypothetical protein D3C87_80210 [compost metagenome]